MLHTGQSGQGIDIHTLPAPYQQTGLDCQVFAIINGMLATGTETELHGISPEIGHTVAVVKERVGSSSRTSLAVFDTGVKVSATAKYSMTNAATALQELGVPLVR